MRIDKQARSGGRLDGRIPFGKVIQQLDTSPQADSKTAVELYKRRNAARDNRKAIRNSKDVFDIMQPLVGDLDNEEFWVMPLNQAGRVIDTIRATMGGICNTPVDIRLIMRKLVEVAASAFIIVHNHPSGNVQPSTDDRRITEAIRKASEIFSIHLHDHVIIGHNRYYSFSDEGVL